MELDGSGYQLTEASLRGFLDHQQILPTIIGWSLHGAASVRPLAMPYEGAGLITTANTTEYQHEINAIHHSTLFSFMFQWAHHFVLLHDDDSNNNNNNNNNNKRLLLLMPICILTSS